MLFAGIAFGRSPLLFAVEQLDQELVLLLLDQVPIFLEDRVSDQVGLYVWPKLGDERMRPR